VSALERTDELKQAIGEAGAAVYEARMLATRHGEPAIADILGRAEAEMTRALALVDPRLRVFPTRGRAETTDELPLAIADAMSGAMTAGDMAKRYDCMAAAGVLEKASTALVSALAHAVD
jgi:hypothetical protein